MSVPLCAVSGSVVVFPNGEYWLSVVQQSMGLFCVASGVTTVAFRCFDVHLFGIASHSDIWFIQTGLITS